ncbi:hypothetical protein FQN54_007678 [Arachnomyces sp. PD_36]|nr:hypothetical protein FQN54_007678 [Arachnomyces sp. PD_36]
MPSSSLHQTSSHTGSQANPHAGTANLRQRPLSRSATFADPSPSPLNLRRSSTLSDSVSEARQSIRSSTDDIFLPRIGANKKFSAQEPDEESIWHSLPLALALVPAVGGLFFQNGSAILTDFTLLVLAAIFLNWSVRLPWDWYRSAQTVQQREIAGLGDIHDIPEEADDDELDDIRNSDLKDSPPPPSSPEKRAPQQTEIARAASKELHTHELVALLSCFVFPLIGAWLLHAIRSQLSRPSEGLVSNYNLTIFLLASEVRPFAHALKMVQARTLYLQRVVASSVSDEDEKVDASKVHDLAKRLEELEAHVAGSIAQGVAGGPTANNGNSVDPKQIISEVRRGFQPDLDALNRAIRRYEKRTTVSDFQTDTRFHEIESRLKDTTTLAADAQRINISPSQRQGVFLLFSLPLACFTWVLASISFALQIFWNLVNLPSRMASWCLIRLSSMFGNTGTRKNGRSRSNQKTGSTNNGSTAFRRKNKGKEAPLSRYPRQNMLSQQKPLPDMDGGLDTTFI